MPFSRQPCEPDGFGQCTLPMGSSHSSLCWSLRPFPQEVLFLELGRADHGVMVLLLGTVEPQAHNLLHAVENFLNTIPNLREAPTPCALFRQLHRHLFLARELPDQPGPLFTALGALLLPTSGHYWLVGSGFCSFLFNDHWTPQQLAGLGHLGCGEDFRDLDCECHEGTCPEVILAASVGAEHSADFTARASEELHAQTATPLDRGQITQLLQQVCVEICGGSADSVSVFLWQHC